MNVPKIPEPLIEPTPDMIPAGSNRTGGVPTELPMTVPIPEATDPRAVAEQIAGLPTVNTPDPSTEHVSTAETPDLVATSDLGELEAKLFPSV